MRKREYHSHSSITRFITDRTEAYLRYLAPVAPAPILQTKAMSAGSAVDAYIKAYLAETVFGWTNPDFELDTLLETQVDKHNREWATTHGKILFNGYKRSGALANLVKILEGAEDIRMEARIQREIEGIILLGILDLSWTTRVGQIVVLDWKCNGYVSNYATTPAKGYFIVQDGWDDEKHTRTHRHMHKDAIFIYEDGFPINVAHPFEDVQTTWAEQLSMYAWLLGVEVGGQFIGAIDQFCGMGDQLRFRIAQHRARVNPEFQKGWMEQIKYIVRIIESGHIFDNLSREESDARCQTLNDYYKAFQDEDKDFLAITRR